MLMKKSILLFRFTLFALMLLSAKGLSAYDFYTGGIYYTISSSGVTVENKGSFNTYSGDVTIPEKVTYGGTTYNVVGIGYQAFKNCTGLTSVSIPKTVYLLLNESFSGCTKLTSIVLPSSITSIYNNAFVGCTALKSIYVMRKTPVSCNTNNFSSSTYTSATLYVPEDAYDAYKATAPWSSFTTIKKTNYDFEKFGIYYKITSTSAKTVKVTYRDTDFDNYSGTVNIPSSVTYDGVTYSVTAIGSQAFRGTNDGGHLTGVVIPNTVKTIESYAFWLQKNLGNVTIPSSVTSIEKYAFCWCSNMTSVTIPNSVTYLGDNAFLQCKKLASLTIGTGVTSIGEVCFGYCEKLTTVTIPNNVKTIGLRAFGDCVALKTVIIGNGVTSIGSSAFENCDAMTTLICRAKTPPTVTSTTFSSTLCANTRLWVPYLSQSAYKSANYWKNFYATDAVNDFAVNGIYYNITSSNTVAVNHKDHTYNSYSGNVNIPSTVTYGGTTYSVTSIAHSAFADCNNLTGVTIPGTVTRIDYYAFALCTKLASITIPNSVTSLGANEFYGCSSLADVTLGSGLTYIDSYAFSNCNALATITCLSTTPPTMGGSNCFTTTAYSNAKLKVPAAALNAYKSADWWRMFTTIEALPFDFCVDGIYYKKTSSNTVEVTYRELLALSYSGNVTIPQTIKVNNVTYKVTAIGEFAFYGCKGLTNVTMPGSVTAINGCAFEGCTGLAAVTLPGSLATLGLDAFARCSALKNIIIPSSVTKIGGYAFSSCTALQTVTIGSGLEYIGDKAFNECSALTTVNCYAKIPPTMEANTCFMSSTYNNATLNVPRSSLNAYKTANWWRMFVTIVGVSTGSDPNDVNGDGEVNIADINAVISAILSGNHNVEYDANSDGEVNVADVNAVIEAVLNG